MRLGLALALSGVSRIAVAAASTKFDSTTVTFDSTTHTFDKDS